MHPQIQKNAPYIKGRGEQMSTTCIHPSKIHRALLRVHEEHTLTVEAGKHTVKMSEMGNVWD